MDPDPLFGDLRCDLRLKTETFLFNINALDHVPAKCFITCLHVCQMLPRKQVGKTGQKFIRQTICQIAFFACWFKKREP